MSFNLEKRGDLEYFVPCNINGDKTAAIFSTRLGGVSGGDDNSPLRSMNLAFNKKYDNPENTEKNYKIIADTFGFSVNNIIYTRQGHTDNILICDKKFSETKKFPMPDEYIYDAMITDIPEILLSVRTADCVPVLFWDKEHNAVGAAHCGWRGTLQKLQQKTALKMSEVFGTSLNNLQIAIGPCISKCCYEVSEEFYINFTETLGERVKIYFKEKGSKKYMCDLKGINKMLLFDIISENNINISPNCTCCEENKFFSHRRQGENRGSQSSFIGLRK